MRLLGWTMIITVVLWGTGLGTIAPALAQPAWQVAQTDMPTNCQPGSTDPSCTGAGVPGTAAGSTDETAAGISNPEVGGAPVPGGADNRDRTGAGVPGAATRQTDETPTGTPVPGGDGADGNQPTKR